MHQLYAEKYVNDKNGEWLVFLHGFGGNTNMWKKQIESFKEKYNLLILDLPGHGKSVQGLANSNVKKFEDIADSIVNVLKENKIKVATFICLSLGTLVFAGLFNKHPEVVKGAILCGAVMGLHPFWRGVLKFCDKIRFCLSYKFLMNVLSGVMLPLKAHQKSRKFFLKSTVLMGRAEFMAWFDLYVKNMDVLKNLKGLDKLKKNLLFISGNEDFTFIKGVKEKWKLLKECKLKVLNKCGHVCNIQKWKEFNEASLEFLDGMV